MMKHWKWIFGAVLALMLAVSLIRIAAPVRQAAAGGGDEDDAEEAVKTPSRVSIENGQTVLTLDAATQSRMGMAVAPLRALTSRKQRSAPAMVLSAQDLVTARRSYLATEANLEKVRTNRDVAQQEYDRLKTLYQDEQSASQKELQAAQGLLRSDQTDEQAASQDLALQTAAVRQNWGDTIASWIAHSPPSLDRVFEQHDFLVQVTLPSGGISRPPETISLDLPGSSSTGSSSAGSSNVEPGSAQAELISRFPRVDPRIQGSSLLYLTASRPGLAPGLNLVAHIPMGQTLRGVLIPQSAVVWWQGNAWVYLRTEPGRFIRRLIPTGAPLAGGLFVSAGFQPGEQVVVRGAQMLLSEEFRSQIQAED